MNSLQNPNQQHRVQQLLTQHLAIWTTAETEKRSGRGRASGNAGSVYGIKKLRELILELAVRGKLVPQDQNDEPASELLKRIQAEKAKLIAEGKLKKEPPLAPISEHEKPFELPSGWEYIRVSEIAFSQAGFAFKSNAFNENGQGLPLIRIRDVGQEFTGTYYDGEYREEFIVKRGDYLISMDGEFRVATWKLSEALLNQRVSRLIFFSKETSHNFVCHFLQNRLRELQGTKAYTTVDHLSGGQISNSIIGFPPLVEQHRIVAKVDALMALCDQLENQHLNAAEAHETLVSELLATLTQSQDAADFNANWQRIYAYFDVLFTTEASIAALKQTLLQLAVMGKLVPQDPNDEPASELLKRIQAEKAKLIAEGKLKKEKPLAPITEEEKPFELPNGWEWLKLGSVALKITDGTHHSPPNIDNGDFKYISAKNIKPWGMDLSDVTYVTKNVHDEIYSRCDPVLGDILYIKDGATTGIATINSLNEPFSMLSSVALLKPSLGIFNQYLLRCMTAPFFYSEMRSEMTGVAITRVTLGKLNEALLPLPPITEQHRIVAKVDELMALCDQLKTRIQQASQQQQRIADALVAQALQPISAEIIDLASYRNAVACYTIKQMQNKPSFGRTQAVKLLYLAQNHAGLGLDLQFERKAAGPLVQWIYDFERQGEREQWFTVSEKSIAIGKTKVEYQVKSAIAVPSRFIEKICSADQRKELDRILTLFADRNTEEAEIIATLFAVWNDFLIDGISPDDAQIIKEVRENWHESKARFTPVELTKWLNWMRSNRLVPQGKGSQTIFQKKLIN